LIVDAHKEIERYHDLRSIVIDDRNTVLVAEIELKEESIVPALRERITQLRAERGVGITDLGSGEPGQVEFLSDRALVQATLERTEQIIDELELRLREQCPRVSHVTIEVEGIVENHPVDKPDG
jgi:zinc transporter 9